MFFPIPKIFWRPLYRLWNLNNWIPFSSRGLLVHIRCRHRFPRFFDSPAAL